MERVRKPKMRCGDGLLRESAAKGPQTKCWHLSASITPRS